jgi:hypothetical protein
VESTVILFERVIAVARIIEAIVIIAAVGI